MVYQRPSPTMRTLIAYFDPESRSFNRALLERSLKSPT